MATVIPPFDRFAGLRIGAQNLAQGFATGLQRQDLQSLQNRQKQDIAADIAALQQFMQQQQQGQRTQLPPGLAGPSIPPPQFPTARSQVGAQLFGNFLLQRQEQRGALTLQAAKPVPPVSGSFQQITDPATGQKINALVNPRTGNIIKKFGTIEEGLSAKDKVEVAITQAKEFRADPTVKNFKTVQTMERNIQAALKVALDPKTKSKAFADQTLVIGFNKLIEPDSVVRESEFARTPEGVALIRRFEAGIERLSVGGVGITDADRIALADMANKLLIESKRSFNATFDDFETRADTIGLNKTIVFGKQKRFDIQVETPAAPESTTLLPQFIPPELRNINKRIAELEAIK